jgi:hypothetical protein
VGGPGWGPLRWTVALAAGGMWWWAVLRLVAQPAQTGVLEAAVAAGGWGLSLLPVHCVPRGQAAAEVSAVRGRPEAVGRDERSPCSPLG